MPATQTSARAADTFDALARTYGATTQNSLRGVFALMSGKTPTRNTARLPPSLIAYLSLPIWKPQVAVSQFRSDEEYFRTV